MTSKGTIPFNSRECKGSRHSDCARQWEGFGYVALCNCDCHRKKEFVSSDGNGIANVIH